MMKHSPDAWERWGRDSFFRLLARARKKRATLKLARAMGERPLLLTIPAGEFRAAGHALVARHPGLENAWRVFTFDDRGPRGDAGPGAYGCTGYKGDPFEGCLLVAVFEYGAELASARPVTAETAPETENVQDWATPNCGKPASDYFPEASAS